MRRRLCEIIGTTGEKIIHPVFGLPGGVARRIKPEEQKHFREVADEAVEFGKFTLKLFEGVVLKNKQYVDLIVSDAFTHKTRTIWGSWMTKTASTSTTDGCAS